MVRHGGHCDQREAQEGEEGYQNPVPKGFLQICEELKGVTDEFEP